MLKVGDFVLNQQTGLSGKVIGYGHQILNSIYMPTLIVRVVGGTGVIQKGFVEDVSSSWTRVMEK